MAIADVPSITSVPLDILDLKHRRRESIFAQMAVVAERSGAVQHPEVLVATLVRAEKACGSALGKGVALPQARSISIIRPHVVLGRSARGIEWDGPDGQPVHLVVLLLSPAEMSGTRHHERLARAAQAMRTQRNRQRLVDADALAAFAILEGGPA